MIKFSDHFGAAYLINLPEREDRLRSAERELVGAGMSLGPAGIEIFPAHRYADPAGFPNIGSRGCFQSHLECLRRARASRQPSVLILEDDIAFAPSLPHLSSAVISQLSTLPWDFVYFGHYGTGDIPLARRDALQKELGFRQYTGDVVSTHFYAVNGRILDRLIAHMTTLASGQKGDNETGPMPLDGAYNIFRRKNSDVRCFIVSPKLGWQSSSASDITPGRLDRLPVLRPMNIVLRSLKQHIARWRT